METETIYLHTLKQTEKFGELLGRTAEAGDIICLDGDLGAGKTTLTQSIAKGLRVPPSIYVSSPSFNIFHEYPGKLPLYHMDFYRLNTSDDVVEIGLDEYLYKAGVCVIEWAERAKDIFPQTTLYIDLHVEESGSRFAVCSFALDYWADRLKSLIDNLLE